MRVLTGDKLPPALQAEVLRKYVHRWTIENARQTYRGECPACAQVRFPYVCGQALPNGPKMYTREQWHAYHVPLTTDAEWLRKHAFRITKGGRLDQRQTFALSHIFAE